jgi:hypothetical protein
MTFNLQVDMSFNSGVLGSGGCWRNARAARITTEVSTTTRPSFRRRAIISGTWPNLLVG